MKDLNEYDKLIQFNSWKHHFAYCFLEINRLSNQANKGEFINKLKILGNSTMDIYYGPLSANQIKNEIINNDKFRSLDLDERIDDNGYLSIILSDLSSWIIRNSDHMEYKFHLHPARYSINTVRIRSTTLKTILALIFQVESKNLTVIDLQLINETRKILLRESPIKSFTRNSKMYKIFKILEKELKISFSFRFD